MKGVIIGLVILITVCNRTSPEKTETKREKNAGNETLVLISTPYGDIKVKLYDDTPLHKENFLKLAKSGFYDGLLFHRVVKEFVIQGGDPDSRDAPRDKRLGMGGPGYTIPAEILPHHFHKKGAVAAARQDNMINPARRSSGSQFYIVVGRVYTPENLQEIENNINAGMFNRVLSDFLAKEENKQYHERMLRYRQQGMKDSLRLLMSEITPLVQKMMEERGPFRFSDEQKKIYTTIGGTPFLDGEYTVFGEVVEGIDVVEKISQVKVDQFDRPLEDIPMKVKVIQE